MSKDCKIPYHQNGFIGTIELSSITGKPQRAAVRWAVKNGINSRTVSGTGIKGMRRVWKESDVRSAIGMRDSNKDKLFARSPLYFYNLIARSGVVSETQLESIHELFFN